VTWGIQRRPKSDPGYAFPHSTYVIVSALLLYFLHLSIHSYSLTRMYQWLKALATGAIYALPRFLSPTSQTPAGLLSQETLQWTESIRIKYNLPGISIGIIASPEHTGHGWKNETHGLGYMDQYGRRIHGDVSILHERKLILRPSLPSLPIRNCLLQSLSVCSLITRLDWRMAIS
jgi:hypothetical protein